MLVEVEIYKGRGSWAVGELENIPDTIEGWIETDGIRRITAQQKELVEWVEEKLTDLYYAHESLIIWLLRSLSGKPRPKEKITKTVREPKGTGDKFQYWEIVYFDGNEVCIVPNGHLIMCSYTAQKNESP